MKQPKKTLSCNFRCENLKKKESSNNNINREKDIIPNSKKKRKKRKKKGEKKATDTYQNRIRKISQWSKSITAHKRRKNKEKKKTEHDDNQGKNREDRKIKMLP